MIHLLQKIAKKQDHRDVSLLQELVACIRPKWAGKAGNVEHRLQQLISILKSNPQYRKGLSFYVTGLFGKFDPVHLYAEGGILGNKGFLSELWSRTKQKLLPLAPEDHDTGTLINRVFSRKDDHIWIEAVDGDVWVELFDLLEFGHIFTEGKEALQPLVSAIQVLSHNVATLGLNFALTRKLPYLDKLDSPFLEQNKELTLFVEFFQKHEFSKLENEKFDHIILQLDQCAESILELRRQKNIHGTSLHLTYLTRRLLQQIERLKILLQLFHERLPGAFRENFLHLGMQLVRAENQKTSLRKLISENADLLAFEIVEHAARKGGKYIADSGIELWHFFRASMLGGFLIAFFASFKIVADQWSLSPLGQGLVYSINYAACFVIVYMLGGIIATKQPAMTASAVARSMDGDGLGFIDDLHGLKELMIKVSRSQFISFVGNLICAFPIAYLLATGYRMLFGMTFVSDSKAASMFQDVHPLMSGALFFAAIAGIFLSLSGLISGHYDNRVVFSKIPQRIRAHPELSRWFSRRTLHRFSVWIEKNLGALAGNISLGFFLGLAGTVGFISGLPIDIRHIAFSSANFGFALESSAAILTFPTLMTLILGIAGIGFFNFVVSFGMTLFIALKSRRVTFGQTRELILLLGRHFLRAPLDFFIQPGWNRFTRRWGMKNTMETL